MPPRNVKTIASSISATLYSFGFFFTWSGISTIHYASVKDHIYIYKYIYVLLVYANLHTVSQKGFQPFAAMRFRRLSFLLEILICLNRLIFA